MGLVFKLLQLFLIVAFNPTRRPDVNTLVNTFHFVFFFQAAGDHIKLQHTNGAENNVVVALREEHLGRTFFGQLLQALAQLLSAQWIRQAHTAEKFWSKVWHTSKGQLFTFSKGIANLNGAVVMQTNNIAGIGFFKAFTVAGKEG